MSSHRPRSLSGIAVAVATCVASSVASGQALEQERLLPTAGTATQRAGSSVAVDGDVLVMGAPFEDTKLSNGGAAFVFRWDAVARAWSQEQELFPADPETGSRFGWSVAIRGDVIAVGAPREDNGNGSDAGATYLFRRDPLLGVWSQEQKLIESGGAAAVEFGTSVGVSGTGLVIGVPRCTMPWGFESGCAYIYRWQGTAGSWTLETMLSDPYGGNRDHAGQAVAIEDHLVLVASPYSHEFGVKDAGSVAVWTESGFNWSHDQKLTASHSTASAAFGASVALRSGAVLVGAPDEDLDPTLPGAGAAYRFAFDGTKYVESARFTAPTPAPGQQFGADVDLFEDLVVVGAPSDDTLGSDAGAAFTFRFGRKAWWFDLPLRASDAAPGDRFGAQVALGGTRIFASVDGHDDAGGADWGMVDAWFAGEVNLEITPASPAPGAAVTLDVFPGTPGDPLVAAIVDVASTPMFVPLFVTTFASDYEWSITGAAPNPAFGVRVGFRAFKISATGPIVFSEIAYVDL